MKILSQAFILIAPHGAGLVNMIFLPYSANVIEIHNRDINHCFRDLAIYGQYGYDAVAPTAIKEIVDINIVIYAVFGMIQYYA